MTKEERFNRALREFINALRLHISGKLGNELDGKWEDRYVETLLNHQQEGWRLGRNNGTDPIQLIDYGNLTSFALNNKEFFRGDFGHRINNLPTYFTDINAARNMVAHNLHFDEDKADTAYLNMIYIAFKLQMGELERELRELKVPTENNNLVGQVESVEVDSDKGEVNRERLRKSVAIRLINESQVGGNTITHANTVFSNINNTVDCWWLNVNPDKFKNSLNILLAEEGELIWIKLKTGVCDPVENFFNTRNDNGKVDLRIGINGANYLRDYLSKKNFDFNGYVEKKVKITRVTG